jgi:hypothetical protein
VADNTTLNTGSGGDVIATDDVGGVKHQLVKLEYGAADSATQVSSANPLPVDAAKQQSTTGSFTASAQSVTLTGLTGGSATAFVYGTFSGLSMICEISPDGTNWFTAVPAVLTSVTQVALSTSAFSVGTNSSTAYEIPLHGASQVRVRSTAFTSGTASVVLVGNGFAPLNTRSVVDLNTTNTQSVSVAGSITVLPAVSLTAAAASAATADSSSARTASGNGSNQTLAALAIGNVMGLWATVHVSAVSGTAPTMTCRLQWANDNGATWTDWDTTNLQTASITATGVYSLKVGPGIPTAANASLNDLTPAGFRFAWTIAGTTPSFTFSTRFHVVR